MVSRRYKRKQRTTRRRRTQRGGAIRDFMLDQQPDASFKTQGNASLRNRTNTGQKCIEQTLAKYGLELTETDKQTIINPDNTKYSLIKHCKEEISSLQKPNNQKNTILMGNTKQDLKNKIYDLWLCLDKAIDDDTGRANHLSDCESKYKEIIPAIRNL